MKRMTSILLTLCLLLCACGQDAQGTWQEQYDLGMKYLSEGSYPEAIIAFTAAIEIDAKRPEAYVGLADVYIEQGDWESAKKVLISGYEATEDEKIKERLAQIDAEQSDTDHAEAVVSEDGNISIQKLENQILVSLNVPGLQSSYAVNREDTPINGCDCSWGVQFTDGKNQYEVGTSHWKTGESQPEMMSLYDMQSDVWLFNDSEQTASSIALAELEVIETTLRWSFMIPEEYEFDAENIQILGSGSVE